MFSGIGQSITKQLVDYEVSNVLVSPKTGDQYITDLDATLDLINGMPGVQRASPQYSKGATFKYRQRVLGVSVRAITPTDEKEVSPNLHENGCRQLSRRRGYRGDHDRETGSR